MPEILSRTEAAQYLRISTRSLDRRDIPRISDRPGARVFYQKSDLDAYLKQTRRRR